MSWFVIGGVHYMEFAQVKSSDCYTHTDIRSMHTLNKDAAQVSGTPIVCKNPPQHPKHNIFPFYQTRRDKQINYPFSSQMGPDSNSSLATCLLFLFSVSSSIKWG